MRTDAERLEDATTREPPSLPLRKAIIQAIKMAAEAPDTLVDWDEHEIEQYQLGVFNTALSSLGYAIVPMRPPADSGVDLVAYEKLIWRA